jgi:RNA polymerase sigma factor (TIGR02999 family)
MQGAEIDELIRLSESGDPVARKKLFAALYRELHSMAQRELQRSGSLTLSPTTLLHETYLSMSAASSATFPDRARFLAYSSRAMRGLVIDHIRSRKAQKRGGAFEFTALPTEGPEIAGEELELEHLGEAVDALAAVDSRLARVVDLKFFCGFSFDEIAGLLGTSGRTVQRDWDKARIFLQHHLQTSDSLLPDGK